MGLEESPGREHRPARRYCSGARSFSASVADVVISSVSRVMEDLLQLSITAGHLK